MQNRDRRQNEKIQAILEVLERKAQELVVAHAHFKREKGIQLLSDLLDQDEESVEIFPH